MMYFSVEIYILKCVSNSESTHLIDDTAIGTTISDLPAKEKLYMQTLARITTEQNTTNTTETSKPTNQKNKKQRIVL